MKKVADRKIKLAPSLRFGLAGFQILKGLEREAESLPEDETDFARSFDSDSSQAIAIWIGVKEL